MGMIDIGSDTGNDLAVDVVGSCGGVGPGAVSDAVGNSPGDVVASAGTVFGTVVSTAESVVGSAAFTDGIGNADSLLGSMVVICP